MAKKDYVKRGRGSQKPSKKKSTPTKKPWKAILLAILVATGFGYTLFMLSQDPEPPVQVIEPAPKPKPTKPKQALPEPPVEKWDYVKSLPEAEVKVVAKEQNKSEVPYIMQCGAYKKMSQAEERKATIAFQGISSKIRKKEGSSWYRVVLGPYERKRDAEKDRHKLQRAKIEPCAIWKDTQG